MIVVVTVKLLKFKDSVSFVGTAFRTKKAMPTYGLIAASRARLKGSRLPSVRSKALVNHSGNAKQRPWKSGKWKDEGVILTADAENI